MGVDRVRLYFGGTGILPMSTWPNINPAPRSAGDHEKNSGGGSKSATDSQPRVWLYLRGRGRMNPFFEKPA